MKGVSSVIAIILILMIVVALAALAYTWFTGIFASLTSEAGSAVTTATGAMATQFRIEAAKYYTSGCTATSGCLNFTIRNVGTQSFDASKEIVQSYVGGMKSTINSATPSTGCTITSLGQGCTATYNTTNSTSACPPTSADPLRVLTATIGTGLTDSRSITC